MNEAAFLRAICENPADDTPRLVFADWLDEHGQTERALFIRTQIELARLPFAELAAIKGVPTSGICISIGLPGFREFFVCFAVMKERGWRLIPWTDKQGKPVGIYLIDCTGSVFTTDDLGELLYRARDTFRLPTDTDADIPF